MPLKEVSPSSDELRRENERLRRRLATLEAKLQRGGAPSLDGAARSSVTETSAATVDAAEPAADQGTAAETAESPDDGGFHRQLLDHIPIQIAVLDPQLRYTYVNLASLDDAAQRRWILGKTHRDYVKAFSLDPTLAEQRQEWMRRAIDGGKSVTYEESRPGADGITRLILRSHTPIFDAQGQLLHLFGYGVDITEHKEFVRRLMEAQKLDAVGKLAGGVGHDFNNLLTAILGYCQLLASEVDQQPKLSRYVNSILTAGHQATTLVRRLLAFGRQQHLETRRLDLNQVLRELRDLLAPTLGENIELVYALSDAPVHIEADPSQVQQVILNLAVNARDAMPDGGRLVLASRWLDTEEESQTLNSAAAGRQEAPYGWVELTVVDTGLGMNEATRQRIFEPFFTTKSQDTGPSLGTRAGLGLAAVYGIIEQSGGRISVRSSPGEGSVFRIVLPAAETEIEEAAPPPQTNRPGGGSEIILVTEDEETVRIFTCEALRTFGYVVLEAVDGVDAMKVCQQHDGPIDLLLTDVVMPRMGGQELATKFVAARPQTRVIFMSGYTGSTSDRRGNLDADIPFLAKPFHLDALSRLVRQELDQKKAPQ